MEDSKLDVEEPLTVSISDDFKPEKKDIGVGTATGHAIQMSLYLRIEHPLVVDDREDMVSKIKKWSTSYDKIIEGLRESDKKWDAKFHR